MKDDFEEIDLAEVERPKRPRGKTKKCKYCQEEIREKAKICPYCRKKQNGGCLKYAVIALAIVIFVLCLINSCSSENQSDKPNNVNNSDLNITDNKSSSNKQSIKELSDSDFSIKEYMYENTIGDTIYFIIVTNNSNSDVFISANGIAKDVSGNSIGADDMEITVIGAGETSIGYFYFDGVTGINKVDYKLIYDKPYFNPIINSLSVEQTLNDKNVILSVTNNSDSSARFVEAYVLFFNSENKIIQYDSKYITDSNSEIKTGNTISEQFDSYKGYDHVEIYLTGRTNK